MNNPHKHHYHQSHKSSCQPTQTSSTSATPVWLSTHTNIISHNNQTVNLHKHKHHQSHHVPIRLRHSQRQLTYTNIITITASVTSITAGCQPTQTSLSSVTHIKLSAYTNIIIAESQNQAVTVSDYTNITIISHIRLSTYTNLQLHCIFLV